MNTIEWKEFVLGEHSKIFRGGSPRPIENFLTANPDGVNWVKIGDVSPSSKYITKTKEKIKQSGVKHSRRVENGDFILSNSMSFGRPYIMAISGCIHDGWLVIKDYKDTFDPEFLYYLLSSEVVFYQYVSMAAGSSVQNLNKEKVAQLKFYAPTSLAEQRAIAEALSDIDKLISALDKKIEKQKMIKQGVMQELLTEKRRLDGFSEPWVEKRLGDILQYEQPTKYIVFSTEYQSNGIPVLTAGKTPVLGYTNETDGVYRNLPVIIFDDFVTCSKYITFPFKVKSSAMKMLTLRTAEYNLKMVYELMQMVNFPLTDHKRYWIGEYSNIVIHIPSSKVEQDRIASILDDYDKEIQAFVSKREKLLCTKQGMMQQLLTGKIRLIDSLTI